MLYEDMAYDLVKFTEKMKIKSSILVGHSMGGKTVMTTSLLYPEIVSRLVVVDMVFKSTPSTGEVLTYLRLLNDMDLTKISSKKEADQYLAQHIESTSLRQFLLTNLDTTRGLLRWRCNLKAMIANYPHIHGTPVIDENITYDRPTLFIGGARSYYIREKDYPEIKARFPNSEIRHIAGAGHWVHSEKPKQFTGILTEFVMK